MKRTTTLIALAALSLPAAGLAAGVYDDRMAGTPSWLQGPPASAPAVRAAERPQERFGSQQSGPAANSAGGASAPLPQPLRQGRFGPADEGRAGGAVREPERLR